ncbi:hypothetical protein Q73_16400 [Bacillus coahuilensis m2-6]|uniref:Uncharacterized protein n=1 Tax=Bacillus coahuilensis p1.1.43 TaxID=1150625 RepID=A0A147K3Q2_9BACI|nr:YaaL family protein [Bacillus coahuilensis]KUP03891.1 hypothetical protein Q75_17275 [Bacillus coahuilensis p1.1.43]KUP04117.1 hypothetical protein Q73_16400 [Bacillus coahuilensis m2-6]
MIFSKKHKLRKEYDEQLIQLMRSTRDQWNHKKEIEEISIEKTFELLCERKIAEAKYFFLFKEAKHRKIVINK